MNICFSTGDDYAPHTAAAMVSVLRHTEGDINFHILHELSEENIAKLQELKKIRDFSLNLYPVDRGRFSGFPIPESVNHLNIRTYFKILLPSIIPDINKILYIDSDIIVIRDLAELWNVDISDYYVAGAYDISSKFRTLGVSVYINAGLLLMNLENMRKDNMEKTLFKFMAEHGDLIDAVDQDLINCTMQGKIKIISDRLNYQYCVPTVKTRVDKPEYIRRPPENIAVLHFAGRKKPWNSYEIKEKYSKEYFDNFRLTPWGSGYIDPPLLLRYFRRIKAFIIRSFKYSVLTVADITGTEKYLRRIQKALGGR
jgi:lipopolysaccharide biosynthesis glycosyltransferase